jgi:purine-binding chemotaxis protein CheW
MKEKNDNTKLSRSCLTFELESKKYATEVTNICEIIRMKPLTRSENMPTYILGTLNLRGSLIPVLNTRAKLGMPEKEIDHETSIIIFRLNKENQTTKIGALIDRVDTIMDISINDIDISFFDQSHSHIKSFRETLQHNEKTITILNPGELLSPAEEDELLAYTRN